jgi:hypothetical protein
MMLRLTRSVVTALALAAAASSLPAQAPKLSFPAPSPEGVIKQRVGFTDIEVVYSRPSARGRKIFGGLVPYGEIWRSGANTATKVSFSTPVKIAGHDLPAGAYALFSIPGESEWTIIFNRVTGEWGAYTYNEASDALRVKVTPTAIAQPFETFTIGLNDLRAESATLYLTWEKTRVPVKIEVDVVKPMVTQIESVIVPGAKIDANTYFAAAMFYYDNGLDLQKAKAWVEAATAGGKAPFFMLYGKARILAKLGDKAGAIAAARASIAAADGPFKAEYTRLNEAVISSLP